MRKAGVCLQKPDSPRLTRPHLQPKSDLILIRSNEMQQYAGVYLSQNHSTCFGCPSNPLSGVHKTVTAASGADHIMCQSNNLPPEWTN